MNYIFNFWCFTKQKNEPNIDKILNDLKKINLSLTIYTLEIFADIDSPKISTDVRKFNYFRTTHMIFPYILLLMCVY